MSFHHFFRHSYGYSLKCEKASPLFLGMTENWNLVKKQIENYLSSEDNSSPNDCEDTTQKTTQKILLINTSLVKSAKLITESFLG